MNAKNSLLLAAAFGMTAAASAQSPITGINLRGTDRLFTSNTSTFVASYVDGADIGTPSAIFAIDYDPSATTLWAIDDDTSEYGTIDIATGDFLSLGVSTLPLDFTNGLTSAPDGTWYAVGTGTTGAEIWSGDVTTGNFTLLGTIGAVTVIDVACDSQGNIYCTTISDDALYSVDSVTGAGTFIGGHGLATNFAQGIDFDWSNDTLYAALYTGGGTGAFCSLSVIDGSIITMEDTVSINIEGEISVQVASQGGPVGTNYCMANPNSSGSIGVMSAVGFDSAASNNMTITASNLPSNQFGIFVTSMTSGFVPNAGGTSNGNICLGGAIGRYSGPGQILSTGGAGTFSLALDLTAVPQGNGTVPVLAGQTWYFQAWHRDGVGLGSNFTDGIQIDFQ